MASEISSYAWKGMADYKNDIDKYLRGEMTPAEMNALEKKALHDPFLADALEGAQQLSLGDFATDLTHLQHALNKRIQKRSIGWIWVGRIAAGLLLLAVSTYVIVLISNRAGEKTSDNLALNKQQEATPPSPAPLSSSDSVVGEKNSNGVENSQPEEAKKEKVITPNRSSQRRAREEQSIAAPPADKHETLADRDADQETVGEADELLPETVQPGIKAEEKIASQAKDSVPNAVTSDTDRKFGLAEVDDQADKARKKSPAASAPERVSSQDGFANISRVNRKIIRGKVTFSEDGMGLPGVNILIKGSNEGTVTDSQGNYEISVEGTQPTLLFSFIGFTNKELIAKSDQLNVQLDADVSELSEVVVVGYGADGSVSSPAPSVMELATPEGGRKAFKQYLESNLQYPEQALKNEVEGKVTIQFSIGMTGQLTDFRVIRGIGFGCDEEVIRLIKAGPKWHPTKKNEEPIKDRVRVRMRFALPKK